MTEKAQKNVSAAPDKAVRERAVYALFALAQKREWRDIRMEDVADEAGIPLPDLYEHFDDRADILAAYGRILDRKMLDNASPTQDGTAAKDALFDLIMERFDLMNEQRAGLIIILKALKFDPKSAIFTLPHLGRSMGRVLEAAGFETEGPAAALKIMGLAAIYLETLRHWMEDESEDLSPTMAALDKNLTRAGEWATTLRIG